MPVGRTAKYSTVGRVCRHRVRNRVAEGRLDVVTRLGTGGCIEACGHWRDGKPLGSGPQICYDQGASSGVSLTGQRR
jgi:hypothetical protein